MSGWYVWTNRDTGVAGWARDEAGSSPSDPALDDFLKPLLANRFPQLKPVDINEMRSTAGVPIVTAAWLPTADRWVFVLRGVGGAFGAAGTTQACAAPIRLPLAQAWPRFWAALTTEERVDPSLLDTSDRPLPADTVAPEAVEVTLRLLATEAPIVEAPVTPSAAIRLYMKVSCLIPESAARGLFWSTCHVASSVMNDERILTGRWPEPLTTAWQRDHRRLTVGRRYLTEEKLEAGTSEESAAVKWLLEEAARGHFPLASSPVSTVAAALDEASRLRPLSLADAQTFALVGGATTAQLDRLAENPGMIKHLARQEPGLARALLDQARGSHLHAVLVLGLILSAPADERLIEELQLEAVTAGGPLTQSIRPLLGSDENRKVAYATLAAYRGDETRLLKARSWLESLGLSPQETPDLFAFDPREVARIAYSEPERAVALLAEQGEPLQRLRTVLELMDPAHPSTMLLLAIATVNDHNPATIENALATTHVRSPSQALDTTNNLNRALDTASDDSSHRDVVAVGFANWLHSQGVSLTYELLAALLALGTGFESKDFAFGAPPTRAGHTAGRDSGRRPESGPTSSGRSGRYSDPGSAPIATNDSRKSQSGNGKNPRRSGGRTQHRKPPRQSGKASISGWRLLGYFVAGILGLIALVCIAMQLLGGGA